MFTELNEAISTDKSQLNNLTENTEAILESFDLQDIELHEAMEDITELTTMLQISNELHVVEVDGLSLSENADEELEEVASDDSPEDKMDSLFDKEIDVRKAQDASSSANAEDPEKDKETKDLDSLEESSNFVFDDLL